MYLIGENINIMSQTIGPAIREKRKEPIQDMAAKSVEAGVDMLDLNLGPARKDGDEMMKWLVETVQEVADIRLSLDTTNPVAMEAGLKVVKNKPLINSASAEPQRMSSMLPLAKEYEADVVCLTLTESGIPRDASERAEVALQLIMAANELGIENESLWIDGIIMPVTIDQIGPREYLEFLKYLPDLTAPPARTTCGLSNVSNGAPTDELRGLLNRTYMMIIERSGQHSAIVDAFDRELVSIAKGSGGSYKEIIGKVIDGEAVNPSGLSEEELKYYKTAKLFTGETLYCHSWLDL